MKVKVKRLHPDAVLPVFGKPGDAGADLTAVNIYVDKATQTINYKTGISIEIPEGYVGLIFPRSSIYKTVLRLTNSVGVIDSGFRGEIEFKFTDIFAPNENINMRFQQFRKDFYQVGDRIGQLIIIPYPQIEFEDVEELSETERGTGGFGSTGN